MIVRRELPTDVATSRIVQSAAFDNGEGEPPEAGLLDALRSCDLLRLSGTSTFRFSHFPPGAMQSRERSSIQHLSAKSADEPGLPDIQFESSGLTRDYAEAFPSAS